MPTNKEMRLAEALLEAEDLLLELEFGNHADREQIKKIKLAVEIAEGIINEHK